MEDIIELLIMFLLFFLLISLLFTLTSEPDISDYCLDNVVLVDSFITYTSYGYPRYYLLYEFSDGSIKEFQVTNEEYYNLIKDNKGV